MKKLISYSFVMVVICYSTIVKAQDDNPGPSISVGAELGLPVGDYGNNSGVKFGDFYSIGLGGSLKAAFPVMADGDITVSAGYLSFSGKTVGGFKVPALNAIPLKAGFRYRFPGGFYLEPQLGYTNYKAKGGEGEGGFTYAGNVGYLINNMIDIAARYEGTSLDGGSISHIGLRIAYAFSLGGK